MNFRLPTYKATPEADQAAAKPVIAYQGREFFGTGDFDNLRGRFCGVSLGGGALSVAFTARWDSLPRWSRVIDFGNGPGLHNIIIGNRASDDTMVFNVWVNSKEYGLHIPRAIVPGEIHRYLCTVTPSGRMEVYRDGSLIGETQKGAAPRLETRRYLYVGGSNWQRDDGFNGLIADLAVWNTLVDWSGKELEYEPGYPEGQEAAGRGVPVAVGPATPALPLAATVAASWAAAPPAAATPARLQPGRAALASPPAPASAPAAQEQAAEGPPPLLPGRRTPHARPQDEGAEPAAPEEGGALGSRSRSPSASSRRKAESKASVLPSLARKLDLAARGPALSYQGREFNGTEEDFEDLAKKSGPLYIGEEFSVAFTARWDSFNGWSRILDFGNGPEKGNIFIGNRANQGTFVFHVWVEEREWRVQIPEVIVLGETHRFLCTWSLEGQMEVFKDGDLMGRWWGAPLKPGTRKRLYVAKSNWSRDHPFHGEIKNLGFWNDVLSWKETLNVGRYGFSGRAIVVDLADVDREGQDFEGREWLESRMRACLPVGWGVQWHFGIEFLPALMHFVGEDTALILRTHRSKRFLPEAVSRALLSDHLTKVTANFDEKNLGWVTEAFGVEPLGVVSLARLAVQKGLPDSDFATLAEGFGMSAHRSPPGTSSGSFVSGTLSDDQVRSVADDAHLNCLLLDKIFCMPDVASPSTEGPTTTLQLKQEWIPQRIVLRGNAFWCAACDKGPMTASTMVEMHCQSQKHRKKMEDVRLREEGLSADYLAQGIALKADAADRVAGAYRCTFCNIGALDDIAMVDAHIRSKGHQKAVAQAIAPTAAAGTAPAPADPFEFGRWNLPDYVQEANGQLVCTLCSSTAGTLLMMQTHLGGDKHARKCRGMGREEVVFIKERSRLEIRATGCPVVRTGFVEYGRAPEVPEAPEEPAPPAQRAPLGTSPAAPPQKRAAGARKAAVSAMMPPGWRAVWDPAAGKHYYADVETQAAQWAPPPPYVDQEWTRKVDPGGRPFWHSGKLDKSFYEEAPEWQYMEDDDGRTYWSNMEGIRFFDKPGEEPMAGGPGAGGA